MTEQQQQLEAIFSRKDWAVYSHRSRKVGGAAGRPGDRRLRGAGPLGRHWAAGYGGHCRQAPGAEWSLHSRPQGVGGVPPPERGEPCFRRGRHAHCTDSPLGGSSKQHPIPRKAVWARPPGSTCSLQPLGLSWFRLSQEEAGAGPKCLPGARVWELRYTVTLWQGCGGQTRTPLRPKP